jgi:isopenicillin N synthase-like dioxygenase
MATGFELPIIDLDPYLNPTSLDDKQQVIAQVRDACRKYGFFGVRNHGVPMRSQVALIDSIRNVMSLPKEEKMAMSFLKNVSRRGYEGSGDSMRDGDALPDAKEVRVLHLILYYIDAYVMTSEPIC